MMYKHYGDKDYLIIENRVTLNKFALSSSPSSTSDYVVKAVYNWDRLTFCRPVDEWTMVEETNENYTFYCDIAYYKGVRDMQFYIVDNCGRVLVCHIEDTEQARIRVIIGQSVPLKLGRHVGITFWWNREGVLLAVQHVYTFKDSFQAIEFRVFEVPFSNGNWSDSEVTNLGSRILFLGPSSSFSIEASTDSSCEKNCIILHKQYYSIFPQKNC
ncbi:hypothetical protein RchiOBHm_Chr7g0210061 [Rosa chinensis]|uniref:KIB1-4 beta-propeller domain-containing protein n=1 Tax=Rosa chinensis TaxID=74649 RepID=A0A2P6PA45_ROSCH|nr:hypothetical protein RchiOBHm_Chr7g0210061 [Rosa chinensis]